MKKNNRKSCTLLVSLTLTRGNVISRTQAGKTRKQHHGLELGKGQTRKTAGSHYCGVTKTSAFYIILVKLYNRVRPSP
jgi:hypothetical protein